MLDKQKQASPSTTWLVGASYGTDDQMPRFLEEGIWENGYDDRHLELVRSMQPGERIAIKAAYTRKHGLCSGLLIPDTDLGENPRRERGV
ncbi:hypothetical protein [Pseudomonas aeruginosa]|uniref:hypothetical protein n=1 Tax=Pseudomonas aeruginosa TaxID=287 RepID=UPI0004F3CC23|nr:hypothetical protein [Pseudomonas aeruginosa]ARN41887.1 hypothetical protein A6747_17895 [Pseudomonas aeruginosa]ELP2752468.1 hypothetical protein [Pseudomonas aeruginosa]